MASAPPRIPTPPPSPPTPTFAPHDPTNPRTWSPLHKYSLIILIFLVDLTVGWGTSGYSPATALMQREFGVSAEVGTLGLSLYVFGEAWGPMLLAPLSEYFGRSPIYIISYGINLLFILGLALVPDLGGVLGTLSGFFAAITIANFGGTIADLFESHETGPAMSIYILGATIGSSSGFFLFTFVADTKGLRAVFWALLGISGGFWLLMIITLRETRHSVILARRHNLKSPLPWTQRAKQAIPDFFHKALKRPFLFLGTEAIVIFSALYNGYLYGISFLFNSAFYIVFGSPGHGFSDIGVGLSFLGVIVGVAIGPLTTALFQEPYLQKKLKENGYRNTPEGRVFLGKIAGIIFPVSLFWFAWTSYKSVHWIVPILASALWGWSFYTLILMTFSYTEDSYKTYSASALAGIGLVRNVVGAGFPLFGTQMYYRLGDQGATSLLAGLAVLMVPIPFVFTRYGRKLREKSPWAREHIDADEDGLDQRVPEEREAREESVKDEDIEV